MPSFSGRFEHLAPGEGVVRSGPCELSFDVRTATLVPASGAPIAFDLGDIDSFTSGGYEIRLALPDGRDIKLIRFAKAFQDLERQLLDAYRDRLVKCLLVSDLNEVARFSGRVELESPRRLCSGPAEIRLYESNLAVLPDAAAGFQWRLADIDAVEFDEARYAVAFARQGERLTVSHLAKRTGELSECVRSRITALTERTARTLHALFPFLSPTEFLRTAGLMRDGTCTPMARVREVHPSIESVLIDKVVDAALKPYVNALGDRSSGQGWYAGFKVIRQEGPDVGAEAEEGPGGDEGVGVAGTEGEMAAESGLSADPAIFEVGDGLGVLYWFFFPLVAKGRVATHAAWEATSCGGRATYVFRLQPDEPIDSAIAELNRGLVSLNFRREPVYLDARTLESELRYRHYVIAQRKVPELARVRQAFAGRAIHTSFASWSTQLDGLLSR